MKTYQKLNRFPLGSIHAEGYLKRQMLIGKDGMCGHLHELEPGMIADPFVNKTYVKGWGDGDQSGWGAEISGNYWTGYIQFAYTLNDPEMIATAENWVNSMMKNQRADGYLGTYFEEDARIYEDYNAWGTACGMRGLLAFYEVTQRKDVLDAVHRCMLWFCENWAGEQKTCYAGQFIIEPMVFTYYYTGDERLREFAVEYLEYLCDHDLFMVSYKTMLYGDFHYNSNHTAGLGTNLRLPALVYSVTGNPDYLKASERRIEQCRAKSVHLSGAPVSMAEYLGPVGAVSESEYCNFAFYNATYSYMSYITGDPKYGDYMEEMFYNGAQGARKKDEKAIAYTSAPNQIYATMESSASVGAAQVYAPCFPVACCPVNAVAVIPEFIRGMMLHDEEDRIYVMAYGPCSLRYKDIAFREKTYYPFRNSVSFEMDCDRSFVFNLKIPAWATGYTVKVNREEQTVSQNADGYVELSREWHRGDTVEISFGAEIKVIKVDDTDAANKHPIAIKYGLLLFSYHIPEQWRPIKGNPITPLPEGWTWYEVHADYEEPKAYDFHEVLGLRRGAYTWNIAVDENLQPSDIEIEELPENEYVWSTPMIKLHTHCYKAPFMCAPYESKTFVPYGEYQYVTEKLPLTLEPYGCTNLRITYFPKAKLD